MGELGAKNGKVGAFDVCLVLIVGDRHGDMEDLSDPGAGR